MVPRVSIFGVSVECLWGPFLPPTLQLHVLSAAVSTLAPWPGVWIPFSFPFLWKGRSDLSSWLWACRVGLGKALTPPAWAGPLFPAHAEHHLPNGVQCGGAGEGVPEPQVHLPQLHGETLGIPDHPATAGENVGGLYPRGPSGATTYSPSTFPSFPCGGGQLQLAWGISRA